ncbi:MAG: hypothetical protein JXR46_01990 [Calditrichaceae bacterium]|nr:hypothetical protein [Calditrichaceae bacterium]MBN2707791.1 hypothetical protein [Calditrichaceae bacterium]RQV96283.1 MAG: hypothetical protein EH224_04965 [Calditrichota bacterium]
MKLKIFILIVSLAFLSRCANYKQLQPDPELTPMELGYIEIKDGDEPFELEKDKKYYMVFPGVTQANFYLVLDITNKSFFNSYLTDTFDDGKGRIIQIPDESDDPGNQSVYSVTSGVMQYYWVIDLVKNDVLLEMNYRYVPKWRFKFENQYEKLKATVLKNSIDQSAYLGIGESFNIHDFNYAGELKDIEQKTAELKKCQEVLKEIESIFPQNILNSTDKAYLDYMELKKQIDEELLFQDKYASTLKVLKLEVESRGKTHKFVEALPEFARFFESGHTHDLKVLTMVKTLLADRLDEVAPHYVRQINAKQDATVIENNLDSAKKLYQHCGKTPDQEFLNLTDFVTEFNKKVDAVWAAKKSLEEISNAVGSQDRMPGNTFFTEYISKLSKLEYNLPKPIGSQPGSVRNATCIRLLNKEIDKVRQRISSLLSNYREAERLVPQLNAYKEQKDYQAMRRLIKQNSHLTFMPGLYKNLDQLSIDAQTNKIKNALRSQDWPVAESNLRDLHMDRDFLNYSAIAGTKNRIVSMYEDSLYTNVNRISRQRAQQFMNDNINTVNKVQELYDNAAFLPVYDLTFTSGSQADLDRKVSALNEFMRQIREEEFPEKSIKHLYNEFTSDLSTQGVYKGRAIVAHGKNYKGKDAATWQRIVECDPYSAKKLTEVKNYRKIFVLPVTTHSAGGNEYLFKLNIQIPSEAKFPVYDVNVKLPKTVAVNASAAQWFEEIKMNGELIKNEGRYTVTSPTASNNYECQITPLRVNKTGDNILEIRFKSGSFQVFEVSVMAQPPIIRKN